ncbi:alpha/beta-hydrolase [Zopfia rhizophila CBS 207.26]|uniref:Alpha/beta-hydrolase n=1 Tax=Zopfia rhizophila CBS 207.26 TaxID=1314779 RepID=A0A6A6E046_9PEZI|nr:alpha/beta-hydrolase [Zopfia rhizophila CBS 207.26]
MATWARQNQTYNLPDGRVLGFAEYGSPHGMPLLFFHGYPSSRLEAGLADEMARRRGLRFIALDRPGFGLSTPKPHRRILDWPADVQAFAQGMCLSRFAVLGLSGGGPFALACAHALPRDMLTGVGLFATGPPWVAGAQHMSLVRRATSVVATYWPSGLRVAMNAFVGVLKWLATTGPVTRRVDSWLDGQERKEEDGPAAVGEGTAKETTAKQTRAERREDLLRILIDEPFAQGAEAAVHEAKLLSSQDWGFRLEDVEYNVVRIWHGAEDKNAPVVMIRYLAERLPHCVLREFEGDTHYTMFKHLEEALSELVPEEASKERSKET